MRSQTLPRVGIIGAGAIGCTLAARFANGGCDVKLAARAEAAATIRRQGLHLTASGTEIAAQVAVAKSPQDLLDRDYVFIAVKQQALLAAVRDWLPKLPETVVVIPAINGIPWWFLPNAQASSTPSGKTPEVELAALLPAAQILGTAVYLTAYSTAHGVAVQGTRNRLIIGELDGSSSARAEVLKTTCMAAGMDCDISTAIRLDVWMKAVGNAVFNPLSVLSGGDMASMLADEHISELALHMLRESLALGRRIGLPIDSSAEERLERARSAGNAQTSMLQDYLKGKPLEVEAIIGAMVRLGRQYETKMPFTEAIYGLVRSASLNNPFLRTTSNTTEEKTK
ncbi:ketopantoate reductase family protein [Pollutimonas harenae]|uniref:2-dehydropantoate 2-reductase n=1 Tax=Pollutimonas harenae TaxID=657015 RepID=A0A853H2P9_9BURK|nr:2-dehydropantoate 2-reductase [Pollutimonas harenae]NYT84434.1 2-dehydropantoate 2-reductase [Pollutimonas harenae]TEA73165.1 2-dehydropantoate 2-reductase [Pollutimonas harenae]